MKPRLLRIGSGLGIGKVCIQSSLHNFMGRYENLVIIRCLIDGERPENILRDWQPIRDAYMQRHGLDRSDVGWYMWLMRRVVGWVAPAPRRAQRMFLSFPTCGHAECTSFITQIPHQVMLQLLATFGATRDAMMEKDLQGWIDANRIYPGIAETVRDLIARHEFYVVTTKQARFAEAILRRLAKVDLPPERIFSQAESGAPKSEILEILEQRHPGAAYYFVEDKALTLHKVMACG